MSAAHGWRVVRRSAAYELRKVAVFRVGFVLREVLAGTVAPLSMIAVYWALYRGDTLHSLRGWTLTEITRYLIGVAVLTKVVIGFRALSVAEQIFEGYLTKYLVMPVPFVLLPLGRWVQYTALQLVVATTVWVAGAALVPVELWPWPADAVAGLQAVTLLVLGSLCFFELYLIINLLAFWLDVIWNLLVMSWMVTSFVGGRMLPVSQMPPALLAVFEWGFPYWSIAAPVELFLGRLGTPDFLRGLCVLAVSLALLELLRRAVWVRGTRRYAGGGM